jgi:hypothetical protein
MFSGPKPTFHFPHRSLKNKKWYHQKEKKRRVQGYLSSAQTPTENHEEKEEETKV